MGMVTESHFAMEAALQFEEQWSTATPLWSRQSILGE
jgi:hypothetical protein